MTMNVHEHNDTDAFARTVLHHAIAHGDRIGQDAAGNVIVALAIPEPAFDALAAFDVDGDADRESQCEDEGGQCDDEGIDADREPQCEDDETSPTAMPGGGSRDDGPVKREEQVMVTGRDGWTYWATLTPDGTLMYGDRIGEARAVA